ncbi:formylglycine-generating enzyme family protein [bacterium]|nr:formylglycine-generating enzyme family protein [bacterium]
MLKRCLIVALIIIGLGPQVGAKADELFNTPLVSIPQGTLKPFYPPSEKEKEIIVQPFKIQIYPVSQKQFLNFVLKNSQWQKSKISKLFADDNYLKNWKTDTKLGEFNPEGPIVHISWYAARSYCENLGLRLPTEAEWEYVAWATTSTPDGHADMEWRNKILEWYSNPTKNLGSVRIGEKNYYGVYNMHGLVWEWVDDFNANLTATDNRSGGEADKNKFCGAGSVAASEKDDYASFMRIAMRSSLKANYTTSNLGFRCAADNSQKL